MLRIRVKGGCRPLIICVTGMPGSGKTLVTGILKGYVDAVISMGDIVRREALKHGINLNSKSIMEFARNIRRVKGANVIAMEVVKEVLERDVKLVVVDGVRSLDEVNTFKEIGDTYVIAVHSSPKTRFNRLLSRGREGDPRNWEEFVGRDLAELELGLGSVIALADSIVINEDVGIDELTSQVINIFKRLVKDVASPCRS